jgi:hypothetical protein
MMGADASSSTSPSASSSSSPYHSTEPSRLATPPTGKPSPVPSAKSATASPVPLSSPAALPGDITLRVTDTKTGKVSGQGPGVINGAAQVAFTLEFKNSSSRPFNMNTVEVNVTYGTADTPAAAVPSASKPFHGTLRPGATASAVYAFAIPTSEQDDVALTAWYKQGQPTVLFQGSVK